MQQRTRAYVASAAIVGIFALVQIGALALVEPFETAGYQAVEDPQNPTNSVVYIVAILVMTALMLAALKYDLEKVIRVVLVGSGAYISLFLLRVLVPAWLVLDVGGVAVNAGAWGLAVILGIALYVYPEWYVIDLGGVLMGTGAAALFGISFGILPALVLLVVLAVYDAISVYGTEHMLELASGVMELKVPIVLVVPLSLSYSYLDGDLPAAVEADESEAMDTDAGDDDTATDTAETAEPDATDENSEPLDREALFIGLGDAIIPTVLVASAGFFAPESVPRFGVLGVTANLPALTAMLGTLAGLVLLLWLVLKGRAHAGLPLLNGGSIAGYVLGALASGMTVAQTLGLTML